MRGSSVLPENTKHLMSSPKGNSEFGFPEAFHVPRGEAEGNIDIEGKKLTVTCRTSH